MSLTSGRPFPRPPSWHRAVAKSELPTATGKVGDKPTLTFPKSSPPPSLQRVVLTEGTGATTVKGDYLVTNYLGQIWGGKVFDNSYDRKATSTFQIGEAKVVPGWDVALVGVKVGSRVLLSLPPSDGYGSGGSSGAGIKGTDTIVFVVDVVSRIASDSTGQTDAAIQPAPKGVPTVTGALGKEPKITIAKGLTEPKANAVYVLAKGSGAKLKAGSVLAQLVVTDWTKSQTQSTWPKTGAAAGASSSTTGLQEITIDTTGALKGLVGVPIGSRVLVLIAASTDSSTGQTSAHGRAGHRGAGRPGRGTGPDLYARISACVPGSAVDEIPPPRLARRFADEQQMTLARTLTLTRQNTLVRVGQRNRPTAIIRGMTEFIILVLVIGTALAFDFTNGFHDTGNAMATSIATGALKPKVAVATFGCPEPRRRISVDPGRQDRGEGGEHPGQARVPTAVLQCAGRSPPADHHRLRGLVGGIIWNLRPGCSVCPRARRTRCSAA